MLYNGRMKKEKVYRRIFYVVAFIFLGLATFASFMSKGDKYSILPRTDLILPTVHLVCCLSSFICIFFPIFPLNFFICMMESTITILCGTEILGVFLFYASLVIILVENKFNFRLQLSSILLTTALFVVHLVTIFFSYPHGWVRTLIAFGSTMFIGAFFTWIYAYLKEKFSCFFPTNVTKNETIGVRIPGSELKLSEYGLTERQINLVIDYIYCNMNYKKLSEKYAMSLSLVKKEFNEVFKIFNVSKIEELYILLLQYQLKK